MASSLYSHQPKVYSNIKDFSNYDYCDESTSSGSDDDSDYEKEIEYSLDQQDRIERIINDSNKLKPTLSKSQLQPIIKSNSKSNLIKSSSSSLKYNTSNGNLLNNIKPIFEDDQVEQSQPQESLQPQKLNNNQNDKINYETSESVYNKIKFDSSLAGRIHEFIICYEDRLGITETPFKSFNSIDIPLHRIQIFKYKDQVIWDKRERIYNINSIYK